MFKLFMDIECFSTVPIQNGVHAYAEHAEVLLLAYAIDDGDVQVWDVTEDNTVPYNLRNALANCAEHYCHNMAFDRTVLLHATELNLPLHKARCTMAQALSHSLPGSLGQLSELYKLGDGGKDKEGKALIKLFCMPTKDGGRNTRASHPEQWAKFKSYAANDIVAMRNLQARMPSANYPDNLKELALWHRDAAINERGIAVDLELVDSVMRAADAEQMALKEEALTLTNGVTTTTQGAKLRKYIEEIYDIIMPDLTKAAVASMLTLEISPGLRLLLENRQKASTTSVAKYERIRDWTSGDGRLRGTLQFCGASRTGRWSGRGPQLQNCPRPSVDYDDVERYVDYFKADCADVIVDDVMQAASDCIRSVFVPADGKKFVVCDLASIEARVSAWGAGEKWVVEAFEAFDAGTGPDLYKLTYSRTFGVAVETVTKEQRQLGKVLALALSYGAGPGGLAAFASAYGVDLDQLADTVKLPIDVREAAQKWRDYALEQGRPLPDMSAKVFIALDGLKRMWRAAHPATVERWATLQADAVATLNGTNTGEFTMVGHWLRMRLPSGRHLCYPQAKVDDKGVISYAGMDAFTHKWGRITTFAGKLAENWVQACSRDVFAANFERVEDRGYIICLHVHDELITETPDMPFYTVDELAILMSTGPSWAFGLPLAAAGFEADRYRKE